MAVVLSCHHCGAPHRLSRGQSRFACEWCGGDNLGSAHIRFEEVVAIGDGHEADAHDRVERSLRRRGVRSSHLEFESVHWSAVWQVVSVDGEEYAAPAMRDRPRAEQGLRIPAAGLVPRAGLGAVGENIPKQPDLSRDVVVAAARGSFDDPEAEIETVRLVWIATRQFRARAAGVEIEGVLLPHVGTVLLGGVPPEARWGGVRRGRVAVYAIFAVAALGAGVLVSEPLARIFTELSLAGIFGSYWFVDRGSRGRAS